MSLHASHSYVVPHLEAVDQLNLDLKAFTGALQQPDLWSAVVFRLMQALIGAALPGIFLKQFPAANTVSQAVYLQLLQADFTPTQIGSLRYVSADVTLFDPASYPLASSYGIAPNTPLSVQGIFAELDWQLPPATLL